MRRLWPKIGQCLELGKHRSGPLGSTSAAQTSLELALHGIQDRNLPVRVRSETDRAKVICESMP
jgi:hypothetical protein